MDRWPAIMSKKVAMEYVGGDGNWTCLLETYPKTLIPFRRTAQRAWWMKETIDTACRQAQLEETLILPDK